VINLAKKNAATIESRILEHALGRLGGLGTRWAAKLLPNVDFEDRLTISLADGDVRLLIEALFQEWGKPVPEFPSISSDGTFSAIIGSVRLNLNHTLVHVRIEDANPNTTLVIRAVAKEGAVRQDSAQKAVARIAAFVSGNVAFIAGQTR
jgi:hypothetical protein